ncbi:hypothetical protein [Aquirufa nivalisilvae]|uniref:hypothetical protein n=1 Tax=Aquirufa nivalisilvae TaxID=2516557 RepID=UPI001E4B6F7F|nr:hypothetical protein [Aquirufa nivalisilvae]
MMFLFWFFTPSTKWVAAIVDKSVLTPAGDEHISFTWLLNQKRLTKTNADRYQIDHDYFGFFPKDNDKFRIKGLERFSSSQLRQLSEDADMAYFTDTYGIYKQEWYHKNVGETVGFGMLYGGLSKQDLDFLQLMKEKRKLIITEFNTIGSPTTKENREKFESMFGMRWTGWTARFFDNLDTTVNLELPHWMIKNYNASHQVKWNFKKSGIAFVNEEGGQVIVLEDQNHLTNPIPFIRSSELGQVKFGLPNEIKYPFWFDVIVPDTRINVVLSEFSLKTNATGLAELKRNGIPSTFPAVIMAKSGYSPFFYFSGDFCDNPIHMSASYFKGIETFKFLFYNDRDPMERKSFFWEFYRPLMNQILDDAVNKPKASINSVSAN